MGIFSVPAIELIEGVAKDFGKRIERPGWADFVKTGSSRERAPLRRDWFYVRMASILYRVYIDGPLGTESLRTYYGGRKRRGVRTEHRRKASGKIIRFCLQNLEKEGLIKKLKKGRGITAKGESYLNKKAKEIEELLKHKKVKEIELGLEKKDAEKEKEKEVSKELKRLEEKKVRKEKEEKHKKEKRKKAGAEKEKKEEKE